MRFWFSLPFIGRTRIGVSVSDREIAKAFRNRPLTKEELEQRAIEEAVLDARAREIANRWAPFVTDVILIAAIAVVVFVIWWAVVWLL